MGVGVVVDLAGAIVAATNQGDDHLYSAQQTLTTTEQWALVSGSYWTIRRGVYYPWYSTSSSWDWELTIKAWGCAEYGTL